FSSGAVIPVAYSAAMRLWPFLALEIALFTAPLWTMPILVPATGIETGTFYLFAWSGTLVASLLLTLVRSAFSRRLAWKARSWQSLGHFLVAQRSWDTMGRLLLLPYLIAVIIIGFTLGTAALSDRPSQNSGVPTGETGLTLSGDGYLRIAQLVETEGLETLNG